MLTYSDLSAPALSRLLAPFDLSVEPVLPNQAIPGSFWGEPEAGLIGSTLYVRPDTPMHSLLHESCHYICMPENRRRQLDTDAGGDYAEENAVCYLQILLADIVAGYSSAQCMSDMDAWGYSFRLGSARKWFNEDAEDAKTWLIQRGLLDGSSGKISLPSLPGSVHTK